jgi:hypothetical protein
VTSAALKAVEAEANVPAEGVLVPLVTDDGSVDILVPRPAEWFEGALEALQAGRTKEWVELALDDDAKAIWAARKKRYKQVNAFLNEMWKRLGEDPGKSEASADS